MGLGYRPGVSPITRLLICLLLAVFTAIGIPRQTTAQADAEALLAASATAIEELQSFHFVITIENGALVILERLELVRAEGDVEQPRTLKVSVTGRIAVLPVTANVIIIGDDVWAAITPRADEFSKIDPDRIERLELTTAFDPSTVLLKAIEYVENPTITGTEELNGETMTVVEGQVDLRKVDAGTPRAGLAQQVVTARMWIDGANLVHRLLVIGPLLESEPEGIVHQLDLSKFDEPVNIVAPREQE